MARADRRLRRTAHAFELGRIHERVVAGLQRARAQGTRLGRPRRDRRPMSQIGKRCPVRQELSRPPFCLALESATGPITLLQVKK